MTADLHRSDGVDRPLLPERIETERLVIRLWELEDAPALHDAVTASVEHLQPWMAWIANEPLSVDERADLIATWRQQRGSMLDAVYGIFTADGTLVGGAGLHHRIEPTGLEIGYWLHVDQTGRGYATETARALTDVALDHPGIDYVEIHHDVANERSGAVPARLGYIHIGDEPRELAAPGEAGITRSWRLTGDDQRS
ncbi:MAG: GNAT family N-acetyltransferase [Acidimicrobiia bacterium]|nr:GNAT family N-acetyltransferase [Acidimicrobiia bacterium]